MRLADAIRLGAMLKPQGFGEYLFNGKTCALGAAMNALGKIDALGVTLSALGGLSTIAGQVFPIVLKRGVTCPGMDGTPHCQGWQNVGGLVIHLNDDHRWTREAIADWLDTIEPPADEERRPDERIESLVGVGAGLCVSPASRVK